MIRTCTVLLVAASVSAAWGEEKTPPKVTFDDHVKPILQQKCFACHNPDKKSSDLDLTTYSNLMAGGAAGAAIEPGDASASYLYALITHADEPVMPPESPKIPDEMIETIRQWIEGGVLENSGSQAKAVKQKKFDMALSTPATDKPAVVPMPARLSLQPVTVPPANTAIDALATSPWAPLVAVGGQKQVLLYHTGSMQLLGVLPFPEGTPRVIKFSRNGSLLLAGGGVGGASGRVVVWDVRSGGRIIEVGEELDEVLAADISSDQTLVALAGPQKVVRIYSTETGRLMHEIRKHTDWITSLEFSPDSVLLASGDRNGGMFVWEAWTGREYLTLAGHTASIQDLSWRSDSSILASASEDTTIRLWELENGGQAKNWGAHGGGATGVEFTRDGRLVSVGRDNTPKLWDQNGAQQLAFEAFGDVALNVSYCDETARLIAGDWTGEIRVWNATDGARLGNLAMNAPTLEQRLQAANEMLVTKQTEHTPVATAMEAATAESQRLRAEMAAAEKQVADAKAALLAAEQLQQKLQPLVQAADAQVVTTKEAFDQSQTMLVAANAEVARWSDEIAFTTKLSELIEIQKSQTAELEKLESDLASQEDGYQQATAALAAAMAESTAVQAERSQIQTQYAAATVATEAAKVNQTNATTLVAAATQKVGVLQNVVTALGETVDRAKEAGQTNKEDAILNGAAEDLNTLLTQKQQQMSVEQATLDGHVKAESEAKAQVAEQEKLAAETLAKQADLEKRIAELNNTLTGMQTRLDTAKDAVQAASDLVAQTRQRMEETRAAISTLQGINPPQ